MVDHHLLDKMNDMKIEITKLQTKTDMIWSDVIDLKKKGESIKRIVNNSRFANPIPSQKEC
jgi:hypothetical protein